MRILVDYFLTWPVYLQRRVRQGDALSPMLYIVLNSWLLLLELFLRSKACNTVFVKDERSILGLFRAISLYERGSGARLKKGKTKAMWLSR